MAKRKRAKTIKLSLSDTILAIVLFLVLILIFWKWALPWALNGSFDNFKHFNFHIGK